MSEGRVYLRGSGILDFEAELREMRPDYFVVNADGHIHEKRELCRELGIEYVILERKPYEGLGRVRRRRCGSVIICLIESIWQAAGSTSPLSHSIILAPW